MTSLDALDNAVRLESLADWRMAEAHEAMRAGDEPKAAQSRVKAVLRRARAMECRALAEAVMALGDEHAAVSA